jgi:hypothetical protein
MPAPKEGVQRLLSQIIQHKTQHNIQQLKVLLQKIKAYKQLLIAGLLL